MIYRELFVGSNYEKNKLKVINQKWFLFFVIVAMTFFSACKKKDDIHPTVKINSPSSGQSFTVGDTIPVSATISDDKQITSVTVRLLNSGNIPVASSVTVPVSANSYTLNIQFIIDNLYLETGNYTIAVVASDEHTETNAFVSIHLNELPKERIGIYVLSSSNNSSFLVSKLDTANNPAPVITVTGDYSGSAIYSRNKELFTLGKITGSFNAFSLANNSLLWSKPAVSFSLPTFQSLFFSDDLVYVSYYDGNIKGYDKNGSLKYTVQQQGFFIPDAIFKNDQYFFSEIYYPGTQLNKIGSFYLVTGVPNQERTLDIDLKNMYTLDEDRLLLFGNDLISGQGQIEIYNIIGNGTTSIHSIPSGSLNSVVQIDNTHYFISHSNGIYRYNYSLNSLVPFVSGFSAYSLEYDDLNQQLFACSESHVNVYNSVNGDFQYSVMNTDSVMDVRILYNK